MFYDHIMITDTTTSKQVCISKHFFVYFLNWAWNDAGDCFKNIIKKADFYKCHDGPNEKPITNI